MSNLHPTKPASTALLVFARNPHVEARVKCLAPNQSFQKNVQVASALLNHTLTIAKASGLAVVWLDETAQRGNNFGERLANAMEDVWAMGFEKQIVIGSDTPGLNVEAIARANEAFETSAWSLGASQDGGTYLIALRKSTYDREKIIAQPWLTRDVRHSLTKWLASNHGKGLILHQLADIDRAKDLLDFLKLSKSGTAIATALREILVDFSENFNPICDTPFLGFAGLHHGLRAPPMA